MFELKTIPNPERRRSGSYRIERRVVSLLIGLLSAVQVACDVNEEVATSDFATSGQALTEEAWNDLATTFYDVDNILYIDIQMNNDDWEALRNSEPAGGACNGAFTGTRYEWYDADEVSVFGSTYGSEPEVISTEVKVKKRGWCSSENNSRPSLKIKFKDDHADEVQDKIGTQYIALNNNFMGGYDWPFPPFQDPHFIRTCLGYKLFEKAGLPHSRCNFANVTVNGLNLGPYINVEPIEELYVYNNFNGNELGNLYEFELGEDFDLPMKDRADIKGFSAYDNKKDFERAAEEIAADNLESVIDVDQFIQYYAMEILLGHFDGYTSNLNNVHVYNDVTAVQEPDPALGQVRFKFIPWGIDLILWGGVEIFADSILAQKVLADPVLKEQLRHQIYLYLGSVFNPKTIDAEIAPHIQSLYESFTALWADSPYLSPETPAAFVDYLKNRRVEMDEFFGVEAPNTPVRIEGWNNECVHRGRSAVDTDAWSIDHKPCDTAVGETYLFNLVPSPDMPGYYSAMFEETGAFFPYVNRADTAHTIATGIFDVYFGKGGPSTDYPQHFALIPVGDGAERRYEIQSAETGLCWHLSNWFRTGENNYQVYQAECDGSEKNLFQLVETPPPPPCNETTALDIGGDGNNVAVPADSCLKVQNNYPWYWGASRTMKLENTTGTYPVPFTWSNTCSGGSGSGTFTANWQPKYFSAVNSACATLIHLQGSTGGTITLRYFAN